jgi:hypothetical protein
MLRLRLQPALAGALVLSALAFVSGARAEDWGTVKGKIVIAGDIPARVKIDVTKDKDACLAKGDLFSEKYVVNAKNKGVQNVIVWLVDASGDFKKPLPIHPALKAVKAGNVEMDQPCCQFIRHVAAIREGEGIDFKNSSSIAHNVHVVSRTLEFNVILPPGGNKLVEPADLPASPTPMLVKCDIHPWMNAYVRIFPHPYFAVTDENGNFTIKNAPAGNYRLVLWHETGWVKGDKTGIPININAKADTNVGSFELMASKD